MHDNRTDARPWWRAGVAMAFTAAPVVLVNVVAFCGQLAFLRAHLPWVPAGQVLMAVTLEVIAVYLAWQAHLAQLANDSALRLRLAAYGFALLIAAMNYSHYAGPGWRPTFVAAAVALCSAASPWLWGVHTRRASRDRLMAAGLVEPHAVRLGGTRWAWHPYRSVRVMRAATWQGTTDPAAAITAVYPEPAPVSVPVGVPVKPPLPTVREVRDDHRCGPATEKKIRRALRARDAQWAQWAQAHERSRGGSPARVPVAAPAVVPPAAAAALNGHTRD